MRVASINVRASRSRMAVFGIIAIILGILAVLTPGLTGLSVAVFLGVIVLAAGILRVFWAFRADTLGRGLAGLAVGGLTMVCGIALLANPLFASGVLTIILALYFVADGMVEIVAAVQRKPLEGWGWLMSGGIVSVLLGLLFWWQYPLAGAWAMGILIGIKLFMIGLVMVAVSTFARPQEIQT
jgi:uncharacterized membrane protein HdeD (DUF308 family)